MLTLLCLPMGRVPYHPREDEQAVDQEYTHRESQEIPIACTLVGDDRLRRGEAVANLFGARQEVRELPDGYAVRFAGERIWAERLLAFILAERECCPFFSFELRFEPGGGPIWLHLRGPEGTIGFIAELLGEATVRAVPAQLSSCSHGCPDG